MRRDLRSTPLYREVEEHLRRWLEPGFGRITGAADPAPSPDGSRIAFTGSRLDALEGTPASRIAVVSLDGGQVEQATAGPNSDRLPAWSPDGRRLAFLSDRAAEGRFQLFLLDAGHFGEAVAAPQVDGTVEYLSWSPDGSMILLGVAGLGADKAGAEGSGTTTAPDQDLPSWIPTVDEGVGDEDWRRAWVYDVATRETRPLSREGLNVWEAVWCGNDRIAAVISDSPDEGAWYEAPLALVDGDSGKETILYRPTDPLRQVGIPAAPPDGSRLAFVEAVCSDRAIIAGELVMLDVRGGGGDPVPVDTAGVDVSHLAWRGEARLLFAGERHLDSVVCEVDVGTGQATELWRFEGSCGYWHPQAEPLGVDAFVTVADAHERAPEIFAVREGEPRTVASFDHAGTTYLRSVAGTIEPVTWPARDGLQVEGFFIRPAGEPPFPTLVWVHGGPIGRTTSMWAMGRGTVPALVSRGYGVFLPNPRGSSGRGQDFARKVVGDMGGEDAGDVLSGIDALVERGLADPRRLGVLGGSYGGFMTAWLVTQDERFAAAVSISPVTDWYSQHWTSNIGSFDRVFVGEDPSVPGGEYFRRSPVMFARNVRTPVLNTAGANDRCTPPGQAMEYHQALLEAGVESQLVIYPEEGHGVRAFPAAIDFLTRVVGWFQRHMPADGGASGTGTGRSGDGDGPE